MNDTTIRAMQRQVHELARNKGWWDTWPTDRLCTGCGFYVDDSTLVHRRTVALDRGHGPIPMGCNCHLRDEDRPTRPTRDEQDRAGRVIVFLALIGTEVSEAIEAVRLGEYAERVGEGGKPEGLPAELADVVIRCLDVAGGLGIDLAAAIERKHAHNAKRPARHGGKLA